MTTDAVQTAIVVIVEDDVTTNRLIEIMIAQAGFQPVCAFSVTEAIAVIEIHRPDIVLLDVTLPDGSGLDLCRRLQQMPHAAQIPVVFISSLEDAVTKVRGFEVGGVDYITKPVNRAELIARVSTHLRLRRAFVTLAKLQAERIQRLTSVQRSLMKPPSALPQARFEVALEQIGQAGGDFYDVISVANNTIDYIVADISGHDLAASIWTSSLKTLTTEYGDAASTPQDTVQSMNRVLCQVLSPGVFFTLVYARINRATHHLRTVNAGHPPPILVPTRNLEPELLDSEGDVVGVFPDARFGVVDRNVEQGDRLFLYSDGLIELGDAMGLGQKRLLEACRQFAREPLAVAVPAIKQYVTRDIHVTDDIVLLGVDV
jgi:sigma-B regulation protein RsbU (phosphoserine phosphatase)